MNHNSGDGFENYRRERERMRRLGIGDTKRPLSGPANALRELEAVEAKEERDRQLTLEMKDFFETATRTAAEIVARVASSARVRIDEQLSSEMEEFLLDSITRMQGLVHAVLQTNTNSKAEEVIEPLMHNLVGTMLDSFRTAGTAGTDKHLGLDPMATNLEEVRREFQTKLPQPQTEDIPLVPTTTFGEAAKAPSRAAIEDHLVAEQPPAPAPASTPDQQDLQRFKQALETLVRQGSMTKDEARAALKSRKPGRKS